MKAERAHIVMLDQIVDDVNRLVCKLAALRETIELVEDGAEQPQETPSPDDFAACNLLDSSTAAERFGLPPDRVRRWCREGCGVRKGGRWLASVPKFKRKLGL
jgi:hypothetical protein